MSRCAIAVLLCLALLPASAAAAEAPSAWFDRFCTANFGAEKEPLAYALFGKDLKFIDDGAWCHASETSACVAFETNLPAKAFVEYGPTEAYGLKTAAPARFFYVHVAHLTGLAANADIHYRLVATDERGNRIVSKDMTLRTAAPVNVVRIPDDLPGPPFVLDKAGAAYLVTRDLTCEGTAFDVTAANVTLDLGGHTVVYDNKAWGPVKGGFPEWVKNAQFGLRARGVKGLRLLNGTLRQGAGNDASESNSIGFNPVYTSGGSGMEFAGLRIVYAGPQQVGIYCHWGGGDSEFHHNVFDDRGTAIVNRHGAGSRALLFYGSNPAPANVKVHHNLVLRTRQGGLSGSAVWSNEIYMDSWATNSFGVGLSSGGKAWNNRILGGGYHVCAFGWGDRLTITSNFVHLRTAKLEEKRWPEYGDAASNNGVRLTQYNGSKNPYNDNLVEKNVIVIESSGGRQTRGVQIFSDPYVKNFVFRENTVKIMALDAETANGACVVTQGQPARTEEQLPVTYEKNTFISNICLVHFGDDYGVGSNHQFIDCRFVKTGSNPKFKTFVFFMAAYPSKKHVVRDCTFEGGAAFDDIQWGGSKDMDLAVQWTVTVKAPSGADLTVKDNQGSTVFTGKVGDAGVVSVPVTQCLLRAAGKTVFTPHVFRAEKDGASAEASITVNARQEINIATLGR